jgi:predicted phosphodiesterase
MEIRQADFVLLHASPGDLWKSPMDPSDDAMLERVYGPLQAHTIVYGHIHRSFINKLSRFTVCNSGSVGMPYDGDARASYLVITDGQPEIRRVEYDIEAENKSLLASEYPHKEWLAEVRRRGAYVAPPERKDSDLLRPSDQS